MNRLLLCLCAFLLVTPIYASHNAGASIWYEYTGNNVYKIYVEQYFSCEPGSVPPSNSPSLNVVKGSGGSFMVPMTVLSSSTNQDMYCPAFINSCNLPGSNYAGFHRWVSTGTATLPAGDTYTISYMTGARTAAILNLINPAGSIYVDATVNTTGGMTNSSPLTPNFTNFLLPLAATSTIRLPYTDAEGDSIVYSLAPPQSGATTYYAYGTGYSAGNPIASSTPITLSNNQLSLTPTISGHFVMDFRVDEYRNGVKIASYLKDHMVLVLPGLNNPTKPYIVGNQSLKIKTCPGQNNSIALAFADPTLTDSVKIVVNTPTIPGFSFSVSNNNGVGFASTTITWTTPASFNPATLPMFPIYITAKDTSCPMPGQTTYALLVKTMDCLADSVWPGDANSDYIVNAFDALYVGVAAGQTGPSRTGASISWVAQACAPWTNSYLSNNVNMKHGDCDGNGTVNLLDLGAIIANYGNVHSKGTANKTTAGPEFYLDATGITAHAGSTVTIPIKLGKTGNQMKDIYGICARIMSSESIMAGASISANNSWLGNGSNALTFTKELSAATADIAIARTDHQNATGDGIIGQLNLNIPANMGGRIAQISFSGTRMINKDGFEMDGITEQPVSLPIFFPVGVGSLSSNMQDIVIVPNPSTTAATLRFVLAHSSEITVHITDITGKTVWVKTAGYTSGAQQIAMPVSQIVPGMYFVKLSGNEGNQTIKWVKE